MGGFRAKDADRERYVDVIEAAYVDGQLGDADRELRVARALTAETLDELDGLTRDLQNRPAPVVPAPAPAARVPVRVTTRGTTPGVGKAVGVVAAVAFLGALLTSMQAEDQWAGGMSEDYAAEAPWEQVQEARTEPGFEMTPRRVRQVVAAYEDRFGTREAYEVTFFPRRVTVQVPVRGPRPRFQRWTWDGAWTRSGETAAVTSSRGPVDLGSVDARRLVDNVATARTGLRVERGRFTHAVLTRTGAEPAVLDIHVGNELDESGFLTTTPAGEIVRRHPYQG